MNRIGDQLTMRYNLTSQFLGNDLPGLIAMRPEQPLEEPHCSRSVPSGLQIDINNLAILVNGPSEAVLLATDSDADFINEESITVVPVFPFQPAGEQSAKLDAPKPDRLSANDNSTLCQEILDITVTEVKPVVKPDCMRNDIWWKAVAFICAHVPILPILVCLFGDTLVIAKRQFRFQKDNRVAQLFNATANLQKEWCTTVIYSVWRHMARYEGCPECQTSNMIQLYSPRGKKLLEKYSRES